jgi:hypothetical protein
MNSDENTCPPRPTILKRWPDLKGSSVKKIKSDLQMPIEEDFWFILRQNNFSFSDLDTITSDPTRFECASSKLTYDLFNGQGRHYCG